MYNRSIYQQKNDFIMQISVYFINRDNLFKSFCQLAEKCFYSKLHSIVFAKQEEDIKDLDKILWTYSQKHFIPHATMDDPLPEKQPIFISNKYENPNDSKIFILFRPSKQDFIDFVVYYSGDKELKLEKLIILLEKEGDYSQNDTKELIDKSSLKFSSINYFEQDLKGKWLRLD